MFRYCCLNSLDLNDAADCYECGAHKQYQVFLYCDLCKMLLCHTCSAQDIKEDRFAESEKKGENGNPTSQDLELKSEGDLRKLEAGKKKIFHYCHREENPSKIAKLLGYRYFQEWFFVHE